MNRVEKNHAPPRYGFPEYLQSALVEKQRLNPRYSLRSFAKYLGTDPGSLSKIISRKRKAQSRVIRRLGTKLGLSPQQIAEFEYAETDLARLENDPAWESQDSRLSLDQFEVISEWYHYAILELIQIEGFKGSPDWISKALKISKFEARSAIDRLVRLNFVEIDSRGNWKDLTGGKSTTTANSFTAGAFRNLQKSVISKALDALETLPLEERDQTSMTLAIDEGRIKEAKEEIKKFRRSFEKKFSQGKKKNRVYQLGLSLYPLSKSIKKDRKS